MATLKRSLSETAVSSKKMKIDKAVQCTANTDSDQDKKEFGFDIGINRIINIKHVPKTNKIQLQNFECGKINERRSPMLALESWSLFCDNLAEIEEAVTQVEQGEANIMYKLHIGNLIFVTVQSNYRMVDIRRWYLPREENPSIDALKPGVPGIALKLGEFRYMLKSLTDIIENLGVEMVKPCVYTHDNQEAAKACTLCNSRGLFFSSI